MFGVMLKEGEDVTLQIKGDGPLGTLMVTADSRGHVRGYVENPSVHLPLNEKGKLNVGSAIGKGMLYVIKDLKMKEPYRGSTPLISGEIGDDLTYYLTRSEQIPSAVALGVLVDKGARVRASGGFMLQLLPDHGDNVVSILETRLNKLKDISRKIDNGMTPEDMVDLLLNGLDWDIKSRVDLKFQCNCSREKMEQVIVSLGKDEVDAIIKEQGKIEAQCRFCNENYIFSPEEVSQLFKSQF